MSDRKVFQNSVTPLPQQTGLTPNGLMINAAEPEHLSDKMTVFFSLSLPAEAQADLEQRVASGEVIPLDELNDKYAPKSADKEALISWLNNNGYEDVRESSDGTGVYARATVEQIQKSLQVDMTRVTKDGITYTAARDAPSLPKEVGEGVHAIVGLQPFRQAHKQNRKCLPSHHNRVSLAPDETDAAANAAMPTTNIDNAPPYLVEEILKAYGADGLAVTGKGQTIAILIDTLPKHSDLTAFWKQNNLPVKLTQIKTVNVKGGPLPPREGEETLDAGWASGIAPGATIRIYASGSLSFIDLDLALDQIIADLPTHPEMRQLSISLGLGETFMAADEVTTQHQKFLRLAAAGVNVFVSSGDAGSNPNSSGHGSGCHRSWRHFAQSCGRRIRFEGDRLAWKRRWQECDLSKTGLAKGSRGAGGCRPARAGRQFSGGSQHRSVPDLSGQSRPDRWYELERTGLGGFLRFDQ
jgi:kumamolisin